LVQPDEQEYEDEPPSEGGMLRGPAEELLLGSFRLYRAAVSPWLPPNCRYYPSCSRYGIEAVKRYGALVGFLLFIWRLLRCNPLLPVDRRRDQIVWAQGRFCVMDDPAVWHERLFGGGEGGAEADGAAAAGAAARAASQSDTPG